jgi:cell wall-associated NlpC family hydrolase
MIVGAKIMCILSLIPLRAEDKDQSEIVSQLLFGEVATILERRDNWLKIAVHHDSYEGWIDRKQVINIDEGEFDRIALIKSRQSEKELKLNTPWGLISVYQGSPILSRDASFSIGNNHFSWLEGIPSTTNESIAKTALSYFNAPYLWGGRTHYGLDCSGFIQTVFHQFGIELMRDASQQVQQGEQTTFEELSAGDVVFFASKETGNVIHVGIYLGEKNIIHAHGRVRIDELRPEGIYNLEEQYYSHAYYAARKFN